MSGYSLTPDVPPPARNFLPGVPPPARNFLPGVPPPPTDDTFLPGVPTPSMTPEEEGHQATKSKSKFGFLKNELNVSLVSLFWTFITFFAIYLSIKCNRGFRLGQFIMALFCSPLYIAYQLAMNFSKCFNPVL